MKIRSLSGVNLPNVNFPIFNQSVYPLTKFMNFTIFCHNFRISCKRGTNWLRQLNIEVLLPFEQFNKKFDLYRGFQTYTSNVCVWPVLKIWRSKIFWRKFVRWLFHDFFVLNSFPILWIFWLFLIFINQFRADFITFSWRLLFHILLNTIISNSQPTALFEVTKNFFLQIDKRTFDKIRVSAKISLFSPRLLIIFKIFFPKYLRANRSSNETSKYMIK